MPVHRVKPRSYRANPSRQGYLKFYDSRTERRALLAWEAAPQLESFGIANTSDLLVPWEGPGRTWWTHTAPTFSLARRSWADVAVADNGDFIVDGKRYQVPEGITPNLKLEPEDLADKIKKHFMSEISNHVEVDHTSTKLIEGLLFVLMVNEDNDNLLWALVEPGTSLIRGSGKVLYPIESGECTVSSASLEESLQGKGIYRRVLKHIRATTNAPVYSGNDMSLKAVLAWMKIGDVEDSPYGRRFKLNPNPSRVGSLYARILRETVLTAIST